MGRLSRYGLPNRHIAISTGKKSLCQLFLGVGKVTFGLQVMYLQSLTISRASNLANFPREGPLAGNFFSLVTTPPSAA